MTIDFEQLKRPYDKKRSLGSHQKKGAKVIWHNDPSGAVAVPLQMANKKRHP